MIVTSNISANVLQTGSVVLFGFIHHIYDLYSFVLTVINVYFTNIRSLLGSVILTLSIIFDILCHHYTEIKVLFTCFFVIERKYDCYWSFFYITYF